MCVLPAEDIEINERGGRNFAENHRETGLYRRFAGDARIRILLQAGVEDRVADLVADFIRMSRGDGFGREVEPG